jgi:hypothetical protein
LIFPRGDALAFAHGSVIHLVWNWPVAANGSALHVSLFFSDRFSGWVIATVEGGMDLVVRYLGIWPWLDTVSA